MCTNRSKTKLKTISKEFKEEAVGLVLEQGYSVPKAFKSVDIAANFLYFWMQSFEDQKQCLVMIKDGYEELKRLRKDNKELRMGKDILKNVSNFCAKEMSKVSPLLKIPHRPLSTDILSSNSGG
jgi:transposase